METVIQLSDVSKLFRPDSGSTHLLGVLKSALKKIEHSSSRYSIRNLNIAIKEGERVGLIGDNGAGKTTLMKLIAGLYQQTSGELVVKRSVTYLGGYGVGMIDEMSVVENVYLYAAIYQVSRSTVRRNLDEIVSWAGLNEFRQTKFKHLSAGMKIRLAVSVTRYFDAEIHLLDETLSAGDQSFRRKFEEVLESYRSQRKTLLTSSHNLSFITDFCEKTIWLESGALKAFGETSDVVARYRDSDS